MIIAHFVNNDGGVGSVVVNLSDEQVMQGINVYVFTADINAEFVKKLNAKVIVRAVSVSKHPILTGNHIRQEYCKLIKKFPSETIVIHAHNVLTIGILSFLKGIPMICTIHGLSTFPTAKQTLHNKLQMQAIKMIIKKIHKCGGMIVGVSNHTSNYYSMRAKCPIYTIYNGGRKSGVKKEYDDFFTIIHFGDISRAKGWIVEFEAFCRLRKKYPQKKIRFFCAGRCVDISENDINVYALEKGLNKEEFQYLGIVNDVQNDILKYGDVMLLMSVSEGLPMSIVESLEMGIPVIATPVGGIPEIIEDGYNGFLIDRDEEQLSEKLAFIMCNRSEWERLSENARVEFQSKFCVEKMASQYMDFYIKVCDAYK